MSDVSRSELDAAIATLRLELERRIDETARHQTRNRALLASDIAGIKAALADPDGWVRIAFREDRDRLSGLETAMKGVQKWIIRNFKGVIAVLVTVSITLLSLYLSGMTPTGAVK